MSKIYVTAKIFKQSLGAFLFNAFGLLAGAVVAYNYGLLSKLPWVIAIYPGVISARGVIGGLFCGRLSTSLHLGTIKPQLMKNTKSFYLLLKTVTVLTLETSAGMSLVALLFGFFLRGAELSDAIPILGITTATMTLALLIVSPLTMIISFVSFKHGLDPDVVLYPVESTVSDFLITFCYIAVLNLFFLFDYLGFYIIAAICLMLAVSALYFLHNNLKEEEFRRNLRESFATLLFVVFFVNVTGSVLSWISETIGNRPEIYTVYPALIDTIGDVGAVVGSTATTKLALGTLNYSLKAIKDHATEILGTWSASVVMFTVYSFISLIIHGIFVLDTFVGLVKTLLATNILAASLIIVVSWIISTLTFHHGLDPDNFVIPIESSFADSITTVSLFTVLILST